MNRSELEEMIWAYWNGKFKAEDDLYNYFSKFVQNMARKFFWACSSKLSYDLDDYIQAGNIAIFKACDKWKDRGFPENIEASMYLFIKHYIYRMINEIDNGANLYSLNKTIANDTEKELGDSLPDEVAVNTFDEVLRHVDNGTLKQELEDLMELELFDTRLKRIIKLRYGFEGKIYSYTEIAKDIKLSVDYVHKCEIKALNILRNSNWTKEVGVLYYYGEKFGEIGRAHV